MTATTSITCVQESLLALEMQRIRDVFQGDANSDDVEQHAALAHATEWLLAMWREDRMFLQKTTLPLLIFSMFEEATTGVDGDNGGHQHSTPFDDCLSFGPWVSVLRRLVETAPNDGCKEFFVRLTAVEFYAFVADFGQEDGSSTKDLARVLKCFMCITVRHSLAVETLIEAIVHRMTSQDAKRFSLQVVEQSETLTPAQKASIFVQVCRMDAITGVREMAARELQSLVGYIDCIVDVLPLLMDKSQKKLRDQVDEHAIAETIVSMAANVSGAVQEKRFTAFVSGYFDTAATLDDVCRLSMHLDQIGASTDPSVAQILTRAVSSVLKPSHFHDRPPTHQFLPSSA